MRAVAGATGLACVSALVAGCDWVPPVMSGEGEGAAQIARLGWLLFAMGAAVLIIVMAALWLAIRGSPRIRSRLASTALVGVGGIGFPAVILTLLLGYGTWLTEAGSQSRAASDALRVEVVGEQWWWRITYSGEDGRSIAAGNEIRIPVGREVLFLLKTADVIHSFWVPNLAGKVDMIPGRTTHLRVRASQAGIFRGQCAEYCGGPHALMAVSIVATPPDEFATWLAAESAPAREPAAQPAQQGRTLFLAAGCGGCHTVRGTPAAGTVGPDLTHVGSRRSIGAGVLSTTQDHLARFISETQQIKPGNRMPPFRVFTAEELSSVASYLEGLK